MLGALLLEQGDWAVNNPEAEAVYWEDLKVYKNNLWSLLGLHQALKMQQKTEEAEHVDTLFKVASEHADIKIQASCMCATKIVCSCN